MRMNFDRGYEEAILRGNEHAVVRLIEELRADPEAQSALAKLSRSVHGVVRAWAVTTAADVLGSRALGVTSQLLDDSDPDVRAAALESLVVADPIGAARLLPEIRRRLGSADYWEPVTALWLLARLNDSDAIPQIRELERTTTRDWHARNATVVRMLLSGESDEILARLASHDHAWTTPLAHAAVILGNEAAINALEQCVGAADDDCAEACKMALARLAVS
jgi:hypothetical protein